ncbi:MULTISPECIES: methyl-accepting chemotaxis protein [Calothrix]|uniref:Methyl-accepting chemotaxis protein n=2 Tax=Calothrix TaxID=1186 RepID=A0ABR8ACL0_9CYAN|nr:MULTISPECIES: CHASE3 domain-containing protein [Calothrix]MBD2197063.1 methyl-accepting chemotaxis protein [Calothrix parietina FACHB-288]MBD2225716.1 methyl-accepting chemotaxis protein [Calothrix anomala FACHB-343]
MQQGIKINQFVIGGCTIIVALTGVTSILANATNKSLIESNKWLSHTYAVKTELKEISKILIDAETGQRGFIITNKPQYLEPYNQAKSVIKDNFIGLKNKLSNNPEQVKKLIKIEELSRQKMAELEETIQLRNSGKEKEVLALINSDEGKTIMDDIRVQMDEMLLIEDQTLEERQKQANQIQMFAGFVSWGNFLCIFIVTLAVALAIILIPSRALARSLQTAFNLAEKVSAGDLTSHVEVTSNDEIGKLMATLKSMTQKLSSLIRQVQSSGIQVTTSATQIAASGKQLEATLAEQVASTNQVTATAKEIAATSRELVNTMEQVATMSQITTQAASVSQKDLVKMEGSMQQLVIATNSIAARLGVISEKANNINNIVLTITKVADQTNLLSLNAAIEAEKAGEYGLGFAVVAREIRRLADQTAIASLDIEQMVKQMQSSVSTGVMEMDKFAAEVGRSMADVGNISTQIGQIITKVQDLNPHFELVNKGMETQSVGAQQISDAMVQLSSTSLQTADSLREINNAIAQLNQVSQGMRQEISRFKVKTDDFSAVSQYLNPIDMPA